MKVTEAKQNGTDVLELVGSLSEHAAAALAEVKHLSGNRDPVVLDLGGVYHVNSKGAALWCDFLEQLTEKRGVELMRCSPQFIDFANLLEAFAGDAEITSFYAPYECKSCRTTLNRLIQTATIEQGQEPAPIRCPSCAGALTLEVPWDMLTNFLEA